MLFSQLRGVRRGPDLHREVPVAGLGRLIHHLGCTDSVFLRSLNCNQPVCFAAESAVERQAPHSPDRAGPNKILDVWMGPFGSTLPSKDSLFECEEGKRSTASLKRRCEFFPGHHQVCRVDSGRPPRCGQTSDGANATRSPDQSDDKARAFAGCDPSALPAVPVAIAHARSPPDQAAAKAHSPTSRLPTAGAFPSASAKDERPRWR